MGCPNLTGNVFFFTAGYAFAPGSFLFSFRNNENIPPFKSSLKDDQTPHAIYRHSTHGPVFGGGHDVHIGDKAAYRSNSYINFGHTYRLPSGYTDHHHNKASLLAGSKYFTPSEVEVFYLI